MPTPSTDLAAVRTLITANPILALVLSNALTGLTIGYFYSRKRGGLKKLLARLAFRAVYSVVASAPGTKGVVEQENKKMLEKLTKSVVGNLEGELQMTAIPSQGLPSEQILAALTRWNEKDRSHWTGGKVSGCIYHGQDELSALLSAAQSMFILSNPLHPDVFPMVRKMEAEVVRMVLNIFQGDAEACGTVTSGGTESILMAVRAAKIYARQHKGIVEPNIIIPETAHAAFQKACEYFEIQLVQVPVDPVTRQADVRAMARMINKNTVLLVGSAPSYANGCIDPIAELGQLALKHDIRLHVDCCLGSFLVAFARIAGYPIPGFDFSVPGVTSISCDTHKYGFAPKGASVVLYRSPELRQCQYFVAPDWCGGIYASPTIAGSRPGAVSAATWAALTHIGMNGYLDITRKIMDAAAFIEKGVRSIDGLRVLGTRHLSIVSFVSDNSKLNIFNINDAMKARGWNLNALQYPASLHICVTFCNHSHAEEFVEDLKAAVQRVLTAKPGEFKDGSAAIYGMAESLPDKSLVVSLSRAYIDALFFTPQQ
eukprot:c7585_g1_i1.p1 GENE.c7585_g1_i1~~c7585_g1_i1.p1  ORF type:complete len:552 (-),score=120.54 c7585_g1_i1:70-1695(-)